MIKYKLYMRNMWNLPNQWLAMKRTVKQKPSIYIIIMVNLSDWRWMSSCCAKAWAQPSLDVEQDFRFGTVNELSDLTEKKLIFIAF